MEKCLVTKLQGIVNNKSLRKLDELIIDYKAGAATDYSKQKVYINSGLGSPAIRMIGSKLVDTSGNDAQSTLGNNYVSNFDCHIYIDKRELLSDLSFDGERFAFNLSELLYCKNMSNFTGSNSSGVNGDISCFKGTTKIKRISLYGDTNVRGDISVLANYDIEQLILHSCPNITGTLDSLLNSTSLFDVQLVGTQISGNVNEFLTNLAKKKKSGNLRFFSGWNEGLKYNGRHFDNITFKFSDSGWVEQDEHSHRSRV